MTIQGDASVEEILDSIKKVIARDNRETVLKTRERRLSDAQKADAQGGAISGRTHAYSHPSSPTTAKSLDVLDLSEMELDDSDDESADQGEGTTLDSGLITEGVRGAMQQNLAALSSLSGTSGKAAGGKSGGTSLEDLTREMLRPMLAQWLEENLPRMVQDMVEAEIARISGQRK